MSRYEKLIREATKPKPGAPKPKYIDPIIASSFSQDGSLQDMCRALASRLQDNSSFVVMRSLIVVHTLIRNGGVDNVLQAMSQGNGALRLRNVAQGGNWQGYDAPRILAPYAAYLDDRIKAFREVRHDVIRAADAARTRGGDRREGAETGMRLRRLTVEKGLLREVTVCQKVCSRLLDVFFAYFSAEGMNDELALTAFRMSLKDLLGIYAAINEGVINVLEHYFEMSKVDATTALEVYRRFCTHTEKIVAFLQKARKIASQLTVTVPNLRHAPISLAGALQEYLDDPNFEKNRQEYKENKRVADGRPSKPAEGDKAKASVPASTSQKSITIQEPSAEDKTRPAKPPTSNQALQDFFESIETDQMSMFGPNAQQQGFIMPQATGFFPQQQMMAPQMTGYNPFFGSQPFLQPQQSPFAMQPQLTGFATGGFLAPQMTGANPFRQSVMMQPTGAFGMPGMMNGMAQQQQTGMPTQSTSAGPTMTSFGSQTAGPSSNGTASQDQQQQSSNTTNGAVSSTAGNAPQRSATAPMPKALLPQATGSRNPFAPPPGSAPPPKQPASVKGPSLFELAYGGAGSTQGPSAGGGGNYGLGAGAWNGATNGSATTQQAGTQQLANPALVPQKTGLIGSIASEFVSGNPMQSPAAATPSSPPVSNASITGANAATSNDATSLSNGFANLSFGSNPTSSNAPFQSSFTSTTPSAIQPQPTGFGGSSILPFKPESSFGQTLASNGANGGPNAIPPHMTGNPFARLAAASPTNTGTGTPTSTSTMQPTTQTSSTSLFGSPSTNPTANTNGTGVASPSSTLPSFLSSTTTGAANGAINGAAPGQPSSLSFFGSNGTTPAAAATNGFSNGLMAQPTGMAGSTVKPFQPSSAFGTAAFGALGGVGQMPAAQQTGQQNSSTVPNVATGSLF